MDDFLKNYSSVWSVDSYSTFTASPRQVTVSGDIVTTNKTEDGKYMNKTLYGVIVVDTDGEILIDDKIVASSPENAKFQLDVYDILKLNNLTLDDVTIIVNSLGTVKVKID